MCYTRLAVLASLNIPYLLLVNISLSDIQVVDSEKKHIE